MATYKDGYMGAFNGKLGPGVGYMWKGRQCLRAYVPRKRNPRTKEQQAGRMVFSTVSQLSSSFREASEIGLRSLAEESMKSTHNIFMSLNRQCVDMEEGCVTIDYPALRVSEGDLPTVHFGEVHTGAGGVIVVDYSAIAGGGGSEADYVYLYAYVPAVNHGQLSMPAARGGNRVEIALPAFCTGHEAHLYGFVWNHLDSASPSTYLGNITII